MKKLFRAMLRELQQGRNVVLCSIIASSGSTPRGTGAKMAVFEDGSTLGTVGGGAVEYHTELLAREIHKTRHSQSKGFLLTKNDVADIGMICGGAVTVYFQFLDAAKPETTALISHILTLLQTNANSWLILAMRDGCIWSMGTYDEKNGLQYTDALTLEQLQPMLQNRAVLQQGPLSFYIEPLVVAGTVYVFGGGHVSQELVPVLSHVDFRVVVFEERPEFCTKERFPTAVDTVLGDFANIGEKIEIKPCDYVVIMTRGHMADRTVLAQALKAHPAYVGVIGSRKKIAKTNELMWEAGLTREDTDRVHAPIGLAIGAETPAEIAISVAGELIAFRAGLEA